MEAYDDRNFTADVNEAEGRARMLSRLVNRLRNHKEWLELHHLPVLSRASDEKLFALYSMTRTTVEKLWEADPDALYV